MYPILQLRFSVVDGGHRFASCHLDGSVALWHMSGHGGGISTRHPYLSFRAFTKRVNDMVGEVVLGGV